MNRLSSEPLSPDLKDLGHEVLTTTPLHPRGEWVPRIETGDIIHTKFSLGNEGVFSLITDFNAFEEDLRGTDRDSLLPQYQENKERVTRLLTANEADVDGYTFWACYVINNKVAQALNQKEQNRREDEIAEERDNLYESHPEGIRLSELRRNALCSEVAVLAKYALQQAGVDSVLVSGDKMTNEQEADLGAHTYLIINPGQEDCLVFDVNNPTIAGEFTFPSLFKPVVPLSLDLLDQPGSKTGKLYECTNVLDKRVRYFGVSNEIMSFSGDELPTLVNRPKT